MKIKIFLMLLLLAGVLFPQRIPKNIIIMIGDGMGLNYVSTNIYTDKESPFGKFTSTGFSLTSSADFLITDSGAGATAISTGYRTKNLSIGVDTLQKPLVTIFELAEKLNKATGLVVTSSVTNATPAAFISHVPNRKMEDEIARQMSLSSIDVVIGGGAMYFSPEEKKGKQPASVNYIDSIKNREINFFSSLEELRKGNKKKPFYALIEWEALKPAAERTYGLKELVSAALENLKLDKDGFVLMVEGSQIDWAAHDHKTDNLIKELKDFGGAVNTALEFAAANKNTLVIVTADHETGGGAIQSGNLDGTEIKLEYTSGGHTAEMVGIFAKGPGEENFRGVMQNKEIGRKLFKLLDPGYKFK